MSSLRLPWKHRYLLCDRGGPNLLSSRQPRLMTGAAEAESDRLEDDAPCDDLPCSRLFLRKEGFTEAQIEAACNLNGKPLSKLIAVLQANGISGQSAAALVSSFPRRLDGFSIGRFCERVRLLEEAGASPALLKPHLLKPSEFFFLWSSPHSLRTHIACLKEIGLSSDECCEAVLRFPGILTRSIHLRLKPRSQLLIAHGLLERHIRRIFLKRPTLFMVSDSFLSEKLQFLEELNLGLKSPNGITALTCWAEFSVPTLRTRMNCLSKLGFSDEDRLALVRGQPSLLCFSSEKLTHKFELLMRITNLDKKFLIQYKSTLAYSLENRIIPRLAILQDLEGKGLIKQPIFLGPILSKSDEKFAEKVNVDKQLLQFYATQASLFLCKPVS